MADSLALSISVPLGHLPEFVAALNAHLEPDTSCTEQDFLELAKSRTEQYFLESAKSRRELALTLRFQKDSALAHFQDEYPDIKCSQVGQVALGCIFATARGIPQGIEITLFTCSRGIVQVLKRSEQVRSFLLRLGALGRPQVVTVTDEWNDVYPLSASVD